MACPPARAGKTALGRRGLAGYIGDAVATPASRPAVTGRWSTRRVVTGSKLVTVLLYSIVAASTAGKPWTGGWDDRRISQLPP